MKYFLFLITLSLSTIACSSKKAMEQGVDKDQTLFEMSTGPCFGKCAVYNLSVKGNGEATLERKRFFSELGVYTMQLPESTMIKIIGAKDQSDFMQLPEKLDSEIPDLQATTFVYHTKKQSKSVWAREQMPKALELLKKHLEGLIADGDWTTVELYEQKPEELDQRKLIESEILVQIQPGVALPRWQKRFENQGIRLLTRVDKEQNIWLYTYSKQRIEPVEMLQKVKADPDVISAEFNYRLTTDK